MKVQDLLEAKTPTYTELQVKDAIKLLNAKCRDAIWMLQMNRPIWRGDYDRKLVKTTEKNGFVIADARNTVRRSANTSNYYTMFFDNLPSWKDWPKRSSAFICSTSRGTSSSYGELFVVIPFDGIKIGCTNKDDLWETSVKIFGARDDITNWNDTFEDFDLSPTNWDAFLKRLSKIDDDELMEVFRISENKVDDARQNLAAEFNRAYSPTTLKYSLHTTETLPRKGSQEVWTPGPCVFIAEEMWEELVRTYKGKR